jgi:hypothetical protein
MVTDTWRWVESSGVGRCLKVKLFSEVYPELRFEGRTLSCKVEERKRSDQHRPCRGLDRVDIEHTGGVQDNKVWAI